jgi:hypothetical protein
MSGDAVFLAASSVVVGIGSSRRGFFLAASDLFGQELNPTQRSETARTLSDDDEKSRLVTHLA